MRSLSWGQGRGVGRSLAPRLGAGAALLLLPLVDPAPTAGLQSPEVAVRGRVLHGPDSLPLPSATIRVEGGPMASTDAEGRFVLRGVRGGEVHRMEVLWQHPGAVHASALFRVPADDVDGFTWWIPSMAPPSEPEFELDPIVVEARSRRPEANRAERQDELGRSDIEAVEHGARTIADLVTGFLGVHVVPTWDPAALCIVPSRGGGGESSLGGDDRGASCPGMVTVVLDGRIVRDAEFLLPTLTPQEVESIRFIEGLTATLRYGSRASGGALVIRTRR